MFVMKQRLRTGEKVELDFGGRGYVFEKLSPYFLRAVTSDGVEKLVSIEGEVEIRVDSMFYERPYFFKWSEPVQASPKTRLKFFLKLPLQRKLVVEAGRKDIVIDAECPEERLAWHGPVYEGVLCTFVEPELLFKAEKGDFANMPVRVVNPGAEARFIKRFVVEPDYLILYHAENGFFTNKVYVSITGEDEFAISYGKGTTKSAVKPRKMIEQKARSPKKVLTTFSPIKLAREFGL